MRVNSFKKIIKRNRNFFNLQEAPVCDQKTIDLSAKNLRLDEVIKLIMWSSVTTPRIKKYKK